MGGGVIASSGSRVAMGRRRDRRAGFGGYAWAVDSFSASQPPVKHGVYMWPSKWEFVR